MAGYSRLFGSQFPDNIIELSNFKDIGEAPAEIQEIAHQIEAFYEQKKYAEAADLLNQNYNLLKAYYIDMNFANKLQEEVYNLGVYAMKNTEVIIADTAPNASLFSSASAWYEPVN